jgi:hypothetical protein
MRAWTVILVVMALAPSAQAQLKEVEFRAPAKPEPFNEKALAFPGPASAGTKPEPFNEKTLTFPGPASAGTKGPKEPPPLWCGGVEFGLSGSEGNSDVFNARLGASAKRQTDSNIFNTDLLYRLSRQNSVTSANNALFNVRDEVLFADSPWGLFLAGQVEYDEFRAYDFRVASHTGVAYGFFRTSWLSLRGRLGAGASREVGGPNDRWVPEGLLGMDGYMELTSRQRLVGSVDYYPDLGHFGEYRVRARAAYEILVDPDWGLTLRLGAQERYDSNPGPAKRNDIDYFATFLFKF